MRRHHQSQPRRRRHRRLGIALPPARVAPLQAEDEHFEVLQQGAGGPIRRMFFWREQDALSFADALTRWMARSGEDGSVRIVWPSTRGNLGG
jgi:hypothetical protein